VNPFVFSDSANVDEPEFEEEFIDA
jgi:hypothetical protein